MEKIKRIVKKSPILTKCFRIIRYGKKIKNTVPKKIIKGTKNVFNIDKSALLSNCTFDITGNNNEIEINESSFFNNVTFFIRGDNNKIKIGKCVRFNKGGSIWIEDYGCEAVIGDNSTFENSHVAVTEPNSKIIIGKDCMFAYDIDLRTGDSHSIINSVTNERVNYAQDINIGNHVWVASHVSILKGVHIADNSVVATRAVVTKSFVESNILIGGMPAKKLKENINWDRERIYK
ncbi:MAG: acyltransferase [Chitinophagaceae bacterium]|jgi:acetyltransferase-like isoleucine patch superfamily enzyme|nr:acyltransferase [Chitinophagaceae bacterium]